jgi:medium-chain acyl-[acyl-carrier-protein] hydrolase
VELPGRGRQFTAPPARRMDVLVDAVSDGIAPYVDRPFAFFGHSMGALVSFEVARTLRVRHDVEPVALYVAAQPAPHLPNKQPLLHELPEAELRAELQRIGGTPREVLANDEFMALLLPTLRADFEVCETYIYAKGAPLSCPIVAYGGADDLQVRQEDLKAWAELTTGAFALGMLPGGHFFIDHNRQTLLHALDASLHLWH